MSPAARTFLRHTYCVLWPYLRCSKAYPSVCRPAILTGVLLMAVLVAAIGLLLYCHRRRRRGRQRSAAGAVSRPHLNGTAGSASAAAAGAGSDHVEMEVLTPMLTHVPPAADHQLDTKVRVGRATEPGGCGGSGMAEYSLIAGCHPQVK